MTKVLRPRIVNLHRVLCDHAQGIRATQGRAVVAAGHIADLDGQLGTACQAVEPVARDSPAVHLHADPLARSALCFHGKQCWLAYKVVVSRESATKISRLYLRVF